MVGWKNHGWQGGLFVAFWRPSTGQCHLLSWRLLRSQTKSHMSWIEITGETYHYFHCVLELNALPQQKPLSSHDITWFYTAAGWWPQTQVKAFAKTLLEDQIRPGRPDWHRPSSKTDLITTQLNTNSGTLSLRKSTRLFIDQYLSITFKSNVTSPYVLFCPIKS